MQGIGFYFSSGDNGDDYDAFGYAHPDYPAGDPWVTAVGGTSLGIGSTDARTFETGWGTSKWALTGSSWMQTIPFQYGAGGGYSEIFAAAVVPDRHRARTTRPAAVPSRTSGWTPTRPRAC